MDISKFVKKIDANREKLASFRGLFDLDGLEEEIAILEETDDRTWFGTIWPKTSEIKWIKNTCNTFRKMEELQDEVEILLDFLERVSPWWTGRATNQLDKMTSYEMTLLLSEPWP